MNENEGIKSLKDFGIACLGLFWIAMWVLFAFWLAEYAGPPKKANETPFLQMKKVEQNENHN